MKRQLGNIWSSSLRFLCSRTIMESRIISLDKFAWRQFVDPSVALELEDNGENDRFTSIPDKICMDKEAFVDRVNEELTACGGEKALKPGYAPFCKHLFVPNFCRAALPDLEINEDNKHFLKTKYEARRKSELPVLVRYFAREDFSRFPVAEFLDIILYSREQINLENAKMAQANGENVDDNESIETAPWGIVSIKPVREPREFPMQPITMLRNALGMEFGGSGVPLDRKEYDASVAYWNTHAVVQ